MPVFIGKLLAGIGENLTDNHSKAIYPNMTF